jgi:hypothetical protein
VLLELLVDRSVLTLPASFPLRAGAFSVPDALPLALGAEVLPPEAGALTLPEAEPEAEGAGAVGADDEDEDAPCARTSDTGAAINATPNKVANKAFISAPPRCKRTASTVPLTTVGAAEE